MSLGSNAFLIWLVLKTFGPREGRLGGDRFEVYNVTKLMDRVTVRLLIRT